MCWSFLFGTYQKSFPSGAYRLFNDFTFFLNNLQPQGVDHPAFLVYIADNHSVKEWDSVF
jgi:hypothetical protein